MKFKREILASNILSVYQKSIKSLSKTFAYTARVFIEIRVFLYASNNLPQHKIESVLLLKLFITFLNHHLIMSVGLVLSLPTGKFHKF